MVPRDAAARPGYAVGDTVNKLPDGNYLAVVDGKNGERLVIDTDGRATLDGSPCESSVALWLLARAYRSSGARNPWLTASESRARR